MDNLGRRHQKGSPVLTYGFFFAE